MSTQDARNTRLMMTAAAVVVAGGVGFGIAKLTTRPAPAAIAETPKVAGPAMIEVPAAHLAAVGIVVEAIRAGSLGGEILAPAVVTPAPNGEAVVTAHAAGTVVRLMKRLGDPVRAGEALALIESRDAATAAADRSTAQAKLDLARKVVAREQHLFDQRVSARQDLEMAQAELAAAQAEARRASVTASAVHVGSDGRSAAVVSPLAGRITAQTAALGAYVEPNAELFRVADPRFVQVEAQVSGADAARLAPGDAAVLVRADGTTIDAVVRSVTPTVSGESRTATVLLNPGTAAGLTPGVGLQARLLPKAAAGAGVSVVVPDEAVQNIDGRDVVFLRIAKGFQVQPVVVASRSGGRASIASGLTAGQSIATRNAFLLKAELQKGGDE